MQVAVVAAIVGVCAVSVGAQTNPTTICREVRTYDSENLQSDIVGACCDVSRSTQRAGSQSCCVPVQPSWGNVTLCFGDDAEIDGASFLSVDAGDRGRYSVTAHQRSMLGGHVLTGKLEQTIIHDANCWKSSSECPSSQRVHEIVNATVPV